MKLWLYNEKIYTKTAFCDCRSDKTRQNIFQVQLSVEWWTLWVKESCVWPWTRSSIFNSFKLKKKKGKKNSLLRDNENFASLQFVEQRAIWLSLSYSLPLSLPHFLCLSAYNNKAHQSHKIFFFLYIIKKNVESLVTSKNAQTFAIRSRWRWDVHRCPISFTSSLPILLCTMLAILWTHKSWSQSLIKSCLLMGLMTSALLACDKHNPRRLASYQSIAVGFVRLIV